MPHGSLRRRLTSYQQGSIFGAVIVFVAMAAAFSTLPPAIDNQPYQKPYAAAENGTAEHRPPETDWQWATADPVAAFTLCLVVVAFGQALLFVWQLVYMGRGLDEAAEAARAAHGAADAARQSNEMNERAFVADHRPWISAKLAAAGRLAVHSDGTTLADLAVTVRNHGLTPATRILTVMSIIQMESDITGEQERHIDELFGVKHDKEGLALFPNERFTSEYRATRRDIGRLVSKTKDFKGSPACPLLLVGVTAYIYTTGQKGITRFAYRLSNIKDYPPAEGLVAVSESGHAFIDRGDWYLDRLNLGNDAE